MRPRRCSGRIIDIDAELRKLDEEAAKAALPRASEHWFDEMVNPQFNKSQRETTTLLVSGLTAAHDYLVKGALTGLGYKVEVIDTPDNDALRYGKEFGNRGQCNPTYFTVGNLVKFLTERAARREGPRSRDMVEKYVFLTAGACGPCRFGMYATEYRKALRDAGFDGFRVMLFQQKGGLKQATGEEAGLEMNPAFFMGLLKAILAGDVINGMGYRLRPFEVEAGATDRAIEDTKRYVHDALGRPDVGAGGAAARQARVRAVKLDWTRPAPRVSIIGEFWAMTTEGDGNYQLQRFLEGEGAECDIQFVTNWLLFMLWEGRYDTKLRAELRGVDDARKGLKNVNIGKKLAGLFVADTAIRAVFHIFGAAIGYRGYHLPDMDEIAETAHKYYDNNVRGGEGHMEVGKFILNVLHNKAHMTLSVKPFGCMPSSGVSDGVQSHDHRPLSAEHLLRDRDLGRRQGQRPEPRADVPLQGPRDGDPGAGGQDAGGQGGRDRPRPAGVRRQAAQEDHRARPHPDGAGARGVGRGAAGHRREAQDGGARPR